MDLALNGFKSTGLWPCNRCVFRDEDFSASMLVIENSLGTEPTQAVTSETETPSIDTFTQENLTAATTPLRNETPEKENLENVAPIASIVPTPQNKGRIKYFISYSTFDKCKSTITQRHNLIYGNNVYSI